MASAWDLLYLIQFCKRKRISKCDDKFYSQWIEELKLQKEFHQTNLDIIEDAISYMSTHLLINVTLI
jgi:hypothetical protein